jgi:alanyl-tRNA synthetase
VKNSGNIGMFRITSEAAVSAGTRRMEAITGLVALRLCQQEREQLASLSFALKVPTAKLGDRIAEIGDELKRTKKDLEKALAADLDVELAKLKALAKETAGVHAVVYDRPGLSTKDGQDLLRRVLQSMGPVAAVIVSKQAEEVGIVACVSPQLHGKLTAGDLVKQVAAVVGGGGGGKPDLAQGKGKDPSKAADAVQAAQQALRAAGLTL